MTPPRLTPPSVSPLADEHSVLCRQLGSLQRHLSAALTRQQEDIRRLEAETVRLRGQLLMARTAILWGLHGAGVQPAPGQHTRAPVRPATTRLPAPPEAREVLCQIGCRGHAHPWLDSRGHCGLDGQACTPPLDSGPPPGPTGAADMPPVATPTPT
ncbi:MAG TPA: hypothetical protein PKC60_11915 [Hydrogenophaga sp.]|uniref:hypothetical protein n=1 Tax=Hydrogenophaga sp. TaxID=1904254 RepID=UPI002CC8F96B|nr:hypothetical protein [Hydrogenophaga sp.]HMN93924.1 hypothetical protein [Hydrogenophaga sp.]HMP12040.1 hypothetical protein [Hydrogenophaga sp.]